MVKVTGNCPELGDWNASNAFALNTNPSDFPIWKAGLLINMSGFQQGQKLEYKYIIVPKTQNTLSPDLNLL